MRQLSPRALERWNSGHPPSEAIDDCPAVLDVRESWELDLARLDPGAFRVTHWPMSDIATRLTELADVLPPHHDVVVLCHHGVRSRAVAGFLERNGYGRVWNLDGGIDAIARDLDPRMPVY
ncbi:MAG: rhodanese-like domain-containing protein [Thioalkalivibrionaceae bacterium]